MVNIFDTVLIVESIFSEGETFILNPDGSASFANSTFQIQSDGAFSSDGGNISSDGSGDLTVNGSALFGNGNFYIDSNGDLTVINNASFGTGVLAALSINSEGSLNGTFFSITGYNGAVSFDSGDIFSDGYGNLTVYTLTSTGVLYPLGISIPGTENYIENNGQFSFDNGAIYSDGSGDLTVYGSALFANTNIYISPAGNIPWNNSSANLSLGSDGSIGNGNNGFWGINYDGSASFLNSGVIIENSENFGGESGISVGCISVGGSFPFYGNAYIAADGFGSFTSVGFTPTTAPSAPYAGQVYFDGTSKHFYGYNGTEWVQLD